MAAGSVADRIEPHYFADILLRIVPGLPRPVVESLWFAHRARCYSPAEFLLHEGAVSQGVFLIVSGLVRLSLSIDREGATRIHCRELRSPAILGVNDVMLGSSVSLTAQAQTAVHAAFIPKADLLSAIQGFPQAGLAFSQLIAEELTSTYSRISELRGTTSI